MIFHDNHDRYSFTIFYSFLDLTIQNAFAIFLIVAYTSETAVSKVSNQLQIMPSQFRCASSIQLSFRLAAPLVVFANPIWESAAFLDATNEPKSEPKLSWL